MYSFTDSNVFGYVLVARDQEVSISSQLGLGVRMLQAQSHVYAFLLQDSP